MEKVILDISMSLDGFICGPDDELERIHAWIFSDKTDRDEAVLNEYFDALGAGLMGRRMFEDGVKKQGWDGWVDNPPFQIPVFVLSHDVPDKLSESNSIYTFITDGIESALAQAKAVAGDKNVGVLGGANIAQQYIQAGLIDEIHIHLVPVLLAVGIRLFEHIGVQHIELNHIRTIESAHVIHIQYEIVK